MEESRIEPARSLTLPVGDQLRAAREAQGLTLGDVAERTRVPSRHLLAIESGDHRGLPAATYSSGFVKTYARLLGLDGQTLAQQFRTELAQTAPRSPFQEIYEPADPARTPSRAVAWIGLLVAVVALLGFLYWRGTRSEDPVRVAAAATDTAAPAPAPKAPATPAPIAPVASGPAVLTADSPVWLRITDAGGTKLFEGTLDTGKSFTVPAEAHDPRLMTGRPNALRVTIGTTEIPPLGPPEQRVKDVSLTPASLLARTQPAAAAAPQPAAANPVPLPAGATTPVENQAGPN